MFAGRERVHRRHRGIVAKNTARNVQEYALAIAAWAVDKNKTVLANTSGQTVT